MAEFNFIFQDGLIKTSEGVEYTFDEAGEVDPVIITSYLGTPVLSNIVFAAGSYERDGEIINFDGLTINTVLMTITQTKNIVKTPMQGRDGTVKEFISLGDYVIGLNGALVNEDGEAYPAEQVNALIELMKVPESLEFTSEFIDRFGSFELTIEAWDIPQKQGERSQQQFSIKAVSDNPIELQLNEESQQ